MILSQKRRNHPKVTSAVKILQGLLSPIRGINKNPDSAADDAIKGGRNISLSIDNIPFGIFHDFAFLHYQIFLGLAKPGKDRGIINDKDLIRVTRDPLEVLGNPDPGLAAVKISQINRAVIAFLGLGLRIRADRRDHKKFSPDIHKTI